MFAINRLNEIIRNTIDAIEKSREEIFDIAENARSECKKLEAELENVKKQTLEIIKHVDNLDHLEKESRHWLMVVSKNIKEYNEEDVRKAYERAKDFQVELITKRTEEQQLIERRSELERRLKVAWETAKKAESLISKVGVAMGYLSGGLQDLSIQLEDIKQKQLLGIKIIKAQEEERKRVAREIHDGPAQLMANLVIKTELCEKLVDMDTDKVKLELKSLRQIARSNLKDVRKIIYDLRPMSLDDLGLIPTVQRFITNYMEDTGINVQFNVYGETVPLKSIIELASFRIIQEALNNVHKHASARNANIKIEFKDENLNILVSDDGKGFDKELLKVRDDDDGGYGLLSMKERVELLNGRFDLNTTPGKGTKIFVSVPLQISEEG